VKGANATIGMNGKVKNTVDFTYFASSSMRIKNIFEMSLYTVFSCLNVGAATCCSLGILSAQASASKQWFIWEMLVQLFWLSYVSFFLGPKRRSAIARALQGAVFSLLCALFVFVAQLALLIAWFNLSPSDPANIFAWAAMVFMSAYVALIVYLFQ
jgi:hypothetical protein